VKLWWLSVVETTKIKHMRTAKKRYSGKQEIASEKKINYVRTKVYLEKSL
jgi:hypothetical protein